MSVNDGSTLDLPAYLARVKYPGPLEPTLEVLIALHEAHTTTVPFENLDVYLGKGIRIDLTSIQAKIVEARRGGYCFEQNTLFAAVLERIGFTVTRLGARVRMGTTRTLPRTHKALRVEVEGQSWLVDVGFGWSGLIRPIPFMAGEIFQQGIWPFRFKREADHWVMEAYTGQAWQDQYQLCNETQMPVDYEMANYMTSTHPESRFVLTVTAQLSGLECRKIVKNREYIENRGGELAVTRLPDDAALLEKLARVFGIVLPPGTTFPKLA